RWRRHPRRTAGDPQFDAPGGLACARDERRFFRCDCPLQRWALGFEPRRGASSHQPVASGIEHAAKPHSEAISSGGAGGLASRVSNNAFNHHHGIQCTERFGIGTDPDGDGFINEMTRADVTAVSVSQSTLSVPGRVIPQDRAIESAIKLGESRFSTIGCAKCHIPALPLTNEGWIYTEPNPFNPPGNLQPGEAQTFRGDLTRDKLPQLRLQPDKNGVLEAMASRTAFEHLPDSDQAAIIEMLKSLQVLPPN